MGSLAAATQFLTRLPFFGLSLAEQHRRRSAYWYGVVGLAIGAALAALELALRSYVALAPRLVLILTANAILTGALHLDGLADTADGLGAGRDRFRALEIMRDSRIGTFGVLALISVLALQFTALAEMDSQTRIRSLVFATAWGRSGLVISAAFGNAARRDGLGAAFIQSIHGAQACVAFLWVLLPSLLLGWRAAAVSAVLTLAVAWIAARSFQRRLGGHTGDTLGFVNELTETTVFWTYMVMR